jgi:hypothetical protein
VAAPGARKPRGRAPKKRPPGRPPFRWTADLEARILSALSAGASYKDAAEFAGLSYQTLLRQQQADFAFSDRLAGARATFKVKSLAYIAKAAETDWRAAAFWLQYGPYRSEWGVRLEPPSEPPAGPGPELAIAAAVRGSDAAVREIHLALAISIAQGADPPRESEPRSVGSSVVAGGVRDDSHARQREPIPPE